MLILVSEIEIFFGMNISHYQIQLKTSIKENISTHVADTHVQANLTKCWRRFRWRTTYDKDTIKNFLNFTRWLRQTKHSALSLVLNYLGWNHWLSFALFRNFIQQCIQIQFPNSASVNLMILSSCFAVLAQHSFLWVITHRVTPRCYIFGISG